MTARQLSLFPDLPPPEEAQGGTAEAPPLTPQSPLWAAMEPFDVYMVRQGFTENTRKSFLGDLKRLREYVGDARPLGELSTEVLNRFLDYLLYRRGRPCRPKTYARRVTTLKVFFRWLYETGVLPRDPAAPLIQRSVRAPLPRPLTDEEVDRLLATAREQMAGEEPDPRPYVLAALLLHTGIKKGECVNIRLGDLDLSAREGPSVLIRYDNPRQQHKERRLALPASLVPAIHQYLAQYQPQEFLFPWTARNLEYVLRDLGRQAGIQGSVSFDRLRWTAALQDWKRGMDSEHLRRKLGLSKIAWQEVEEKLQRLSEPPL